MVIEGKLKNAELLVESEKIEAKNKKDEYWEFFIFYFSKLIKKLKNFKLVGQFYLFDVWNKRRQFTEFFWTSS